MLKSAVGMVGISITDFYSSEPREINLALEGYQQNKEETFRLNQYAFFNAIGMAKKKGFKPVNPFEKRDIKSAQSSKEDKATTLDYLFKKLK